MEIVDADGSTVVEYGYDAWGKNIYTKGSKAEGVGKDNPFRYRGYVYDEETELYYLRSRYYDSEWGRFLNADSYIIKSKNVRMHSLFCYCGNNPVNSIDTNGHEEQSVLDKVEDFFERINGILGSNIDYSKFGPGEWKYKKTIVRKTDDKVEEIFSEIYNVGSSFLSAYATTVLISNPVIGGVVGVLQYGISRMAESYIDLTEPNVPNGVYTLESVSYTQKEDGPFGIDFLGWTYNKTYYYLHGKDVSGCEYFAIWEESYIVGLGIMDASSKVLAQRTQ